MSTKKKVPTAVADLPRKGARASAAMKPQKTPQRANSARFEAALEDYTTALELLHRGRPSEALEHFRAIESKIEGEPVLAQRARTYAVICSRKLAPPAGAPVTDHDCYLLGVVRTNEGRLDEAVDLLDRAIRQRPGDASFLYARAAARALQGNALAAAADLRNAIAIDPLLRHQAAGDTDFEKVRDEAVFIDVIEPTPAGA